MKRSRTEYRITVKRAGRQPRVVLRYGEATARKYLTLLGPEPWKAYAPPGADADTLQCCDGYECGCGGLTWGEASDEKRKHYTPIQSVTVEARVRVWELTRWQPALFASGATSQALADVEANPDEPDEKWEGHITPENRE